MENLKEFLNILNKLKLRVASKESPESLDVIVQYSNIPHKEFTAALNKNYDTNKLLKDLRGSVKGHKFNIVISFYSNPK